MVVASNSPNWKSTHRNLVKPSKFKKTATKEPLSQKLFRRADALRQLKEVMPLNEWAQLELDAGMANLPTLDSVQVLRYFGFRNSRVIASSKSAYRKSNPSHLVVFNSQIFTRNGTVIYRGDLDLTLDAARLTAAARSIGEPLFVLREGEQPGEVSELPQRAVWFAGLAEVAVPLAEIARVYGRGVSSATLVEECAELQARLRAQLSVHCHVSGSWLTRRKASIVVSYCGPALSESEVTRMAHGVERVMEPD